MLSNPARIHTQNVKSSYSFIFNNTFQRDNPYIKETGSWSLSLARSTNDRKDLTEVATSQWETTVTSLLTEESLIEEFSMPSPSPSSSQESPERFPTDSRSIHSSSISSLPTLPPRIKPSSSRWTSMHTFG